MHGHCVARGDNDILLITEDLLCLSFVTPRVVASIAEATHYLDVPIIL